MNTSITPSNNFGGGKVKFFTGGSGGTPQNIRLVPINFGSNQLVMSGTYRYLLQLNRNTFGRNEVSSYGETKSYVAGNGTTYFYSFYGTIKNVDSLSGQNISLIVRIKIDDNEFLAQEYTLDDGNNYTQDIVIDLQTLDLPLNTYPINQFYTVKFEFGGDHSLGNTYNLYNGNHTFLAETPDSISYNSILSSSFFGNSIALNNSTGNNFYFLSFGGTCYAVNDNNQDQKFYSPFNGEIRSIYFMLNELGALLLSSGQVIRLSLRHQGSEVVFIEVTDTQFAPYEIIEASGVNIPIGIEDELIMKISGTNLTQYYYIAEVGCRVNITGI